MVRVRSYDVSSKTKSIGPYIFYIDKEIIHEIFWGYSHLSDTEASLIPTNSKAP